jgi:Zn-dependent protease with chaperone function
MRLEHQRSWGMTERLVADWLHERLISMAVSGILWTGIVVGLYVLIRRWPRRWWLAATSFALVGGLGYAFLQPLVIAPLFNTFTPLRDTKWANLEPHLRALIDRAGIDVRDILVIDASRQGRHTNAYFAGFGPSRRIVFYDNLLQPRPRDHAAIVAYVVGHWQEISTVPGVALMLDLLEKRQVDELQSILGHEIGHWKHDHIVKGIALAVPGTMLALFLLSRALLAAMGRGPWQLRTPWDPAGIPLVLLLYFVGMWLAMPIQNGISREFERQADRMALGLARQPEAFIAAERRLVRDNIGNVAPTPWNVWLFATHPTAVEAIRMAEEWRAKQSR